VLIKAANKNEIMGTSKGRRGIFISGKRQEFIRNKETLAAMRTFKSAI
jgi:hypothetical protein